jgi:hypothetical protein
MLRGARMPRTPPTMQCRVVTDDRKRCPLRATNHSEGGCAGMTGAPPAVGVPRPRHLNHASASHFQQAAKRAASWFRCSVTVRCSNRNAAK